MVTRHLVLLVALSLPGFTAQIWAQAPEKPMPEKVKKAIAAVKEDLAKRKGPEGGILWKSEDGLAKIFPDHVFVIARYRLFPVARVLPEGLRASNVFAVKDGKVLHLKDAKSLEKFFKDHQSAVKGEKEAILALNSWLALTQEYHQDGMFQFETLAKEFAISDGGKTARGRAIVMKGGNGELAVTLTFADGKLASVQESAKIRAGPRPICQATKLLDADPVVRKIAEQDLLIMGLAARAYLEEQRNLAGPELRRAIEGIWERIQKQGW